ncbi:MAG: hypothetical protein L0G93_12160 [Acinetobacter sp.]|nr:hypothetical protein [Acinetobacter sp.]MDN5649072.1 hypothetical protein [Acinetobacter sp.]
MQITIETRTYILDPEKLRYYNGNTYIYNEWLIGPQHKQSYQIDYEKLIILISVAQYTPLINATIPQTLIYDQFLSPKLNKLLNGLKKLDIELSIQQGETVLLPSDIQIDLGMQDTAVKKEFSRNMLINILNSGAEFFLMRTGPYLN